jgi:VIT1/CCC1 family predicted Fe2+/Mn2+ transporter
MSSATGSSRQSSTRTTALILLAFGVVCIVVGILFISHHHLRATASFIVAVLALGTGAFMLVRKPR